MDQTQYEALLNDAEARLDRLRALYEQFFQGLERLEPTQLRKDFERIVTILRKEQPRNTALRFRFQQLVQRNITHDTYWRKVMRQIEDGTYRRDVLRARRRRDARGGNDEPQLQVHEIDMSDDADDTDYESLWEQPTAGIATTGPAPTGLALGREPTAPLPPPTKTSPPPAPRAVSPFAAPSLRPSQMPPAMAATTPRASQQPVASKSFRPPKPDVIPPPPRFASGVTQKRPALDAQAPRATVASPNTLHAARQGSPTQSGTFPASQMQQLYSRYMDARRGNNERTDNIRMETLQKTVEAMLPKLREKHGGKQIDFDVVVRDGKVALKPITK